MRLQFCYLKKKVVKKKKGQWVSKNTIKKSPNNIKQVKKITRMNSANKTSAKKYSWNFQKKWVRLEHGCVKKSPKKRAPTKKTDNSTGNRTPGLQWIIGFPSSITYTLNRSSEVQTNGNPYLVKFTTEKKTWLKSTLPLAYWKRPCCTFASPNLPRKSQLSWDFIKTKTIGVMKKESIKMLNSI